MPRARSLAPVPCSLQWARIGVIMVACSWHDALGADQLPREIVGNWCLEIERMLPETYAYRRCKDSSYHIIVRSDGFDAQETSCEVNKIERKGAAWLASFSCSGAGLSWLEEDEIRVTKNGWTALATLFRSEIERMLPETYAYRRCKDSSYHIIVRSDGFDAQETSCEVNKIERKGAAWLASFSCSGAGLSWLEEDEIRVTKNGWTALATLF